MPIYQIRYTTRASIDQEAIYQFILEKWGKESVKKLDQKIEHTIKLILKQPEMSPISTQMNSVRKCVITKQTTLYYRIHESTIELLAFFDNRQNPDKNNLH